MKPEKGNKKIGNFEPHGYVALPFSENQFKEFVVGLLGKPQSISGENNGIFEIEMGDLKNIYSLINQRISQQNDSQLISFNANIVFSDDTTVLVNTIEELLSYNEIKPVVSKEIHLTFAYLIKFHDKNVPEKQEINISFIASKERKEYDESKIHDLTDPLYTYRRLRLKRKQGYIQYNIKHTARTWGTDIEALLSNHFSNLVKRESKTTVFLREYSVLFGFLVFFSVIGLAVYFGQRIKKSIKEDRISEVNTFFKNHSEETLGAISQKLEFMATLQPNQFDMSWMIFISFFIGVFGMVATTESFSIKKHSHILLTKEATKFKVEKDKEYKNQFRNFLLSIIISIACSIVANYLFEYFNLN